MKKVIIFDVDGVITQSGVSKEWIILQILKNHALYDIPWVHEIFRRGLNRVVLIDKIYEIKAFDKQAVLRDINTQLAALEWQVPLIADTTDFIEKNFEKYIFFTNTSLPKQSLKGIFKRLHMGHYFMELLAYDDGSKKENIEYVQQVYDISPENILFIDDNISHIDAVKNTWVHTLLFEQDGVSLEKKISNIF